MPPSGLIHGLVSVGALTGRVAERAARFGAFPAVAAPFRPVLRQSPKTPRFVQKTSAVPGFQGRVRLRCSVCPLGGRGRSRGRGGYRDRCRGARRILAGCTSSSSPASGRGGVTVEADRAAPVGMPPVAWIPPWGLLPPASVAALHGFPRVDSFSRIGAGTWGSPCAGVFRVPPTSSAGSGAGSR